MGKWIEVTDIEQPAAAVAAEIMQQRVEAVHQRLPLAAEDYCEDLEHVHQLRVGCRRSGAALKAFRPLLKSKAKKLRNSLRDIRRAAGPARDADVLLQRIEAEPESKPCHDFVTSQLREERETAQAALVEAARKKNRHQLLKYLQQCVELLEEQASKSKPIPFDAYARKALFTAGEGMFQLSAVQAPSLDQLHQLRIAGKRLRYSIELFHSAFPVVLRKEIYPLIEDIQGRLGRINDHATAQQRFQHWLATLPPDETAVELANRIVEEYQAATEQCDEFLDWWTPERAAQIESQINDLLK